MLLTLQEACNILHVDEGNNDEFIFSLIDAIPDYIEVSTGVAAELQYTEPLAKVAAGFILTSWYYADHADDIALTRAVDSLFKAMTIKYR